MPENNQLLFRETQPDTDWFNAAADDTGLRLTGIIHLEEIGVGNYHGAYQWVDFWYHWIDVPFSWGDQSKWYQDGSALKLEAGHYHLFLQVTTAVESCFNVMLINNNGGWRRIGFVNTFDHGFATWSGFVTITEPQRVRFEAANPDTGGGLQDTVDVVNWCAIVQSYDFLSGSNPDEVLTRFDGETQWTNESSTEILGGLVNYTASSNYAKRPDHTTFAIWDNPEITTDNLVNFTIGDYIYWEPDWAFQTINKQGLYLFSWSFTSQDNGPMHVKDHNNSGRGSTGVGRVARYCTYCETVINITQQEIDDRSIFQFILREDTDPGNYFLWNSANVSITRLGPAF